MARLDLHVYLEKKKKEIQYIFVFKESIAPFWQALKMKCSQLLFQYFSIRSWEYSI